MVFAMIVTDAADKISPDNDGRHLDVADNPSQRLHPFLIVLNLTDAGNQLHTIGPTPHRVR